MSTEIVFETHSWSEDNDRGYATGWLPGRLSAQGRTFAAELGARRRDDGIAAVFTSDLRRATETAEIAFGDSPIPVLYDWRLRECDYGTLNGTPAATLHKGDHLDVPFPGGESWRQAVHRNGRFLSDVPTRWNDTRILVIGHVATRWSLDHLINGIPLEELAATDFAWREGWEYRLSG
ncbi:histidine phosphatase family protein [Actinoplanes sp. NPDC048796]|uniref:histidine phosphatase family protein n=1 Tax=unclassified Actinoplanes TaxID=2626549 RepID=UPI0033CF8FFE